MRKSQEENVMENKNCKAGMKIRTDLALEVRESLPGDGGEVEGVLVQEWKELDGLLRITEVMVETSEGASVMGKPIGTYLTIEAKTLAEKDEDFHQEVSKVLAVHIRRLMKKRRIGDPEEDGGRAPAVLVVGLGNPAATPDSLGPKVLEHLQVTRHLSLEYGTEFCERNGYPVLSGLAPGVMAQTGMETAEIIRGVVKETKPDLILVVDALAARSAKRLGTTIQLSDAGIHPGSGVGNHRNSLTEETMQIPVLALGVPTVIGAAAVVQDTMDAMIETLEHTVETKGYGQYLKELNREEQYQLLSELLEADFGPMYVTPYDMDERVKVLSFTISEAIHEALFR